MDEETSARIGRLAGDYLNITTAELTGLSPEAAATRADEIKAIAGSALTQTPGQATPEPETFRTRLFREFADTETRLGKLSVYLTTGAPDLSDEQRELLYIQRDAMRVYHSILKMRINALENSDG